MVKKYAKLQRIDHDHKITEQTDYLFLHLLQHSLLLSLKELGRLNMMQYRHAAEQLNKKRREHVHKQGRQKP